MSRVTARARVQRYRDGGFASRADLVAGEEPLEIRVGGESLSVTMRTAGHDIELVHGFLHAEGIIADVGDVTAMRYCDGVDEQGRNTYNVLDVQLAGPVPAAARSTARAFVTSSACGVCGTASIEALKLRTRYHLSEQLRFDPAVITAAPGLLRAGQKAFATTGGIHGAALLSPDGSLRHVREDIGRHNAVDKVIGAALLGGELPLSGDALLTSSRASFELVQKAVMAGLGMLIAVSAPSSLAVELATETGLTLVGFTRDAGFNLYSGALRVVGAA
ncbi:FdhD protein [Nakamurella sp. UYEF19]|uniref:formate dehydrogenase accessory sulfurtransferase FdhD n=1 Tax=Nakamurella sp. UYEF19 TaxID=1756392 RepID=UPI003392B1E5